MSDHFPLSSLNLAAGLFRPVPQACLTGISTVIIIAIHDHNQSCMFV
jgi:hypothetical protein